MTAAAWFSGCAGLSPQTPAAVAFSAGTIPFHGRLVDGDASSLPPMVARALDPSAPVEFFWREDLTHGAHTEPLFLSAINPMTYAGASTGDYKTEGFAELTIRRGDRVLGDYSARTSVTREYNIYGGPTHREVDHQARDQLSAEIERQIIADLPRLSHAVGAGGPNK